MFSYSSKIVTEEGPNDFIIHCEGNQREYKIIATSGPLESSLIVEGRWCRGVYSISDNGGRTLLRQAVFNISPGITKLVFPIIKLQGTRKKLDSEFRNLVNRLENELMQ